MKKVIIYTNFDKESEHAVNYGVGLALRENYGIDLLHVINTAHYAPDFMSTGDEFTGGGYISTAIKENTVISSEELQKIKADLKNKYPQLSEIHYSLKSGIDTKVVIHETSQEDVAMLIFPDYKREGFLDFIIDIGPEIIAHARCPVLVVPEKTTFQPIRTIVFATDYEEEDIDAIKKLVEIARPFNSEIKIVHLTDNIDFVEKIEKEGFTELIKENVNYNKITLVSLENKDIVPAIMNFSANNKADIIAILKENKNFLARIFEKSISKNIVKNSNIPVLIFHKQ